MIADSHYYLIKGTSVILGTLGTSL